MLLRELASRRVALLGYGREGAASAEALHRAGARSLVVIDDAPQPAGLALPWRAGGDADRALDGVDAVLASPGIPPRHAVLARARERGVPVTTATNVFFAECAEEDVSIVAVTGSKGKSTTSTLLARSLERGGRASALVGNVGAPALRALDAILATRPVVVFEMSSYQAHALDRGPETAVITSLFPEHLDWHGGFEAYAAAKLRVAALQDPTALTIYDGSDRELRRRAPLGPARHEAYAVSDGLRFEDGWFLRGAERLFPDERMRLRGAHNRRNACAVVAACAALGVGESAVEQELADFAGLPHRLEDLGVHEGVRWINDSISTAPEAGVAALEAFAGEAATLIAGGHDRGYDFAPLARAVRERGIAHVGALPPSGAALAKALRDMRAPAEVAEHADLASAVAWAARVTPRGATVVFSPSSPSYGAFRDFEERGERFRELVRGLG